jgi:hypothetical protein
MLTIPQMIGHHDNPLIDDEHEPTDGPDLLKINGPPTHAAIIDHIVWLCGFAEDSTMVKNIDQQGWTKLSHVTAVGTDEINGFQTEVDDGLFEAKPMVFHLRLFKFFILFYRRINNVFNASLMEDDIIDIRCDRFHEYCVCIAAKMQTLLT